jgi:glycine C-acetyltransferase
VDQATRERIQAELDQLHEQRSYKHERVLTSPQGSEVRMGGRSYLNFCANNYLGLANDARLIAAAHAALDEYGFGLSSVRFICGTQDLHTTLEKKISHFLQTEDTILYSSCFDANGGLFETLLGPEDAILSDALNHASIIDGIRLCKAQRFRYAHADVDELEKQLKETQHLRSRWIITDGVFSMDGDVAPLQRICDLADHYHAQVIVDDSHATGFFGPTGRGSIEAEGVLGRVDVVTSTLGKALGGASGGFTSARSEIVQLLRQHSRPYLFSNTLAPVIVATAIACIDLLEGSTELRDKLARNTQHFRGAMSEAGFEIPEGEHPIVPILLHDSHLASEMAERLLSEGIYVISFSYPVVPKGQARIRVQLSASHSSDQIDRAVSAFEKVAHELGYL